MILNFDSVEITSLTGMQRFGEFTDAKKMTKELDKLRKSNLLNAIDHSVLMIAFRNEKKVGAYRLSFLAEQWVITIK